MKRNDFVDFPDKLDMSKYVYTNRIVKERKGPSKEETPKSTDLMLPYQLCAVISHLGAADSGHYVTYRKGPLGSRGKEKWFYVSDEHVEAASETQVHQTHAFLLFYERIEEEIM